MLLCLATLASSFTMARSAPLAQQSTASSRAPSLLMGEQQVVRVEIEVEQGEPCVLPQFGPSTRLCLAAAWPRPHATDASRIPG